MQNFERYKIIIVGSGLAAYSVIQKFKNSDVPILIIEGGSLDIEKKNEALQENYHYGQLNHWNLHWLRVLGGTSKIWGGMTSTLSKSDLKSWPLDYEELKRYYIAAWNLVGQDGNKIIDLYENNLTNNTQFNYKPFVFTDPKIVELTDYKKFSNVDLIKSANLVKLISQNRKSITGLKIFYEGKYVTKEIKDHQKLVLAMGGLGNAQILLQPNDNNNEKISIGNESGLVGKYLMEHPHVSYSGDIYYKKEMLPKVKNLDLQPAFVLNDNYRFKKKLLNCSLSIEDIDTEDEKEQEVFEKIIGTKLTHGHIYARSEQEPLEINSLTLTNEKNWAGIHKLRIRHSFSALDLISIEEHNKLFGEYLVSKNLGFVKIINDEIYKNAQGGGHTMGTTRMGESINDSVCNKNNKVHGYENLFLSGSSVFTTGGASNPTISIIALGLRLSNYLKENLNV